jgi:hypothetical protein
MILPLQSKSLFCFVLFCSQYQSTIQKHSDVIGCPSVLPQQDGFWFLLYFRLWEENWFHVFVG